MARLTVVVLPVVPVLPIFNVLLTALLAIFTAPAPEFCRLKVPLLLLISRFPESEFKVRLLPVVVEPTVTNLAAAPLPKCKLWPVPPSPIYMLPDWAVPPMVIFPATEDVPIV